MTIQPKPKMVTFRKRLMVAQWVIFLSNLLLVALEVAMRQPAMALMNALAALVVALALRFLQTQTNRPRVKPILVLTPEGLLIDGVPPLGIVPWTELADIAPRRFLFVPVACLVPRDSKQFRARLGSGGKHLWMYWMPGGYGISCISFSLSPQDLCAQLNAYRLTHDTSLYP